MIPMSLSHSFDLAWFGKSGCGMYLLNKARRQEDSHAAAP